MKISNRIKELRIRHNLTQQQFANELEINVALVAHWETERNNPKLENLTTICEKFGVTADWLLFGKIEKGETSLAGEPESEYQRRVSMQDSTDVLADNTQGEAPPTEADSLRAEVKQLRNELWLSSQKWDKRVQHLEALLQIGFDKMAEALTQHPAAVQKDMSKAKGAPSRKK